MRHLALYRKWRPQRFADLVGQEHISRTLLNALRQDHMAHAYLFCGPRGTGKTTSARLLAKALNCLDSQNGEPCNACQNCEEITAGHSLDVIEIDAASNRGIDSARELREQVRFAASGGRYRVFIIDEFHMLTKEAFNALLKTLEEPPERVIFVLATTEPHEVLQTIVSRCQRFDFQRIATRELAAHLQKVATAEQIGVSPAVLEAMARKANGGLRDGLSLLDQVQTLGEPNEILPDALVYQILGLVQEEDVLEILRAGFSGELESLVHSLQRVLDQGHDPMQLVQELLQLLRHLSLAALPPAQLENLGVPSHLVAPVKTLGEQVSRGALVSALDLFLRTSDRLHHCAQPEIWLEADLISFCLQAEPSLLQRLEQVEQQIRSGSPANASSPPATQPTRPARPAQTSPVAARPASQPAPPPISPQRAAAPAPRPEPAQVTPTPHSLAEPSAPFAAEPAPEAVPVDVDSQDLGSLWQAFLGRLKAKSQPFYGFVSPGQLTQIDSETQTWIVVYPDDKEPMMRRVEQRLKDGRSLQNLVSEVMGAAYNMQVRLQGEKKKLNPEPDNAPAPVRSSSAPASSPAPSAPASAPAVPRSRAELSVSQPAPDPQPNPQPVPVRRSGAAIFSEPLFEPETEDLFDEIDMDFLPEAEPEPIAERTVPPARPAQASPAQHPPRNGQAASVAVSPAPVSVSAPVQAPVLAARPLEPGALEPDSEAVLPERAHLEEIASMFKGKIIQRRA